MTTKGVFDSLKQGWEKAPYRPINRNGFRTCGWRWPDPFTKTNNVHIELRLSWKTHQDAYPIAPTKARYRHYATIHLDASGKRAQN